MLGASEIVTLPFIRREGLTIAETFHAVLSSTHPIMCPDLVWPDLVSLTSCVLSLCALEPYFVVL